jgi:hypothetical protein
MSPGWPTKEGKKAALETKKADLEKQLAALTLELSK